MGARRHIGYKTGTGYDLMSYPFYEIPYALYCWNRAQKGVPRLTFLTNGKTWEIRDELLIRENTPPIIKVKG
jgi:hypothetical protein